ncbi:MAG: peptidoglycan DD-metalloendopeptidase family protein [Anaerolineae bacterium]|nr:peptidoglycan DD-metalloendopeptidase family protein [Anaerolineae bacterium]MCI0608149.1 peptidoglycan DD-metalloendopeptidase family protein [Anaerolineae bacterium]
MAIKLIVPVNGPITQLFGENPERYKQWGFPGHNGVDYGIPNGTPVGAAVAGTVAAVAFENGGYGNYVKLSHMDGSRPYFTYYAHLASAAVSPGQKVKAGITVGFSNNTGASTGPHLHFGVKIEGQNPAYKGYVDPMPLFTAGGEVDPTDTTSTDQFTDAVKLPNLSFEVLSDFLNVRNGPGVEFSIVGQLLKGAKITGKRLQSKSVWIEYEPGKWCAVAFNGIVNLKVK